MKTKPKIIDLSNVDEKYFFYEASHKLLNVTLDSEESYQYTDIIKQKSHVELRGTGNRYNGVYFVESVSHRIKKGRYNTTFRLRVIE